MSIGNDGGRPAMYETPEALTIAVDEYFKYILGESHEDESLVKIWDRYPEPPTVTGLALFLGFSDRQSLYDYQNRPEFSCIIKKARTRVEHGYEKSLSGDKPTGAIFALKNMGWKDKSEVEQTVLTSQIFKIGDTEITL